MSLAHFWGGLAVGLICGAAIGLDQYCRSVHSLQIGATTMLLLTGYITTIYRQVRMILLVSVPAESLRRLGVAVNCTI